MTPKQLDKDILWLDAKLQERVIAQQKVDTLMRSRIWALEQRIAVLDKGYADLNNRLKQHGHDEHAHKV